MATQIQLTNTFNEFRQAYNVAANDIGTLQSSSATIIGLPVPATQTFVVISVANPGTPPPNNIFNIDGVNNPSLSLVRGGVYTFNQSSNTNITHQLAFRTSANASFTTGVTTTGTAGQANSQVVFIVPDDAPNDLRYYCIQHGNGMGNTITVTGTGRGGILPATNVAIATLQGNNTTTFATIAGIQTTLDSITGGGGTGISGTTISANLINANNIIHNGLTSTRIPFANAASFLLDDNNLTYTLGSNTLNTANLNVTTTANFINLIAGNNQIGLLGANGTIQATGNLELSSAGSGVDAFYIEASDHVSVGDIEDWATSVDEDLSIHRIISVDDSDSASDHAVINRSDGVDAYAELIAMNDVGNSEQGWCSVGINSSNYAAAQYGVTKADDGYLLYQPPEGTINSGDLVIGTGGNGTGNKILFSANGFDDPANNTQMTIDPGNRIIISINTESSNSSTGALVVQGGIGLQGNLNVGGNVAISGTITLGGGGNTVSTSSLTVNSPIIFLGQNNAADTFDLGTVGEFTDGVEKYTGFVRDASDNGVYKLFSNTSILPTNTVDFTDPNLVFSGIQVGDTKIVSGTSSSSTTTGALVVTGGVGVSGDSNLGGLVRATNATTSTSTSTGAVVITGGVGIAGNTHIGGSLVVNDAIISGLLTTESVAELTTNITGNGVTTFNFNDGNVFAVTPTANFTANFTNVPLTNSRVYAMTLILTQGSPKFDISGVQIDGVAQTIKYAGNVTPTFTINKTEIVVYTLVRTSAGNYVVLGQLSQYG